MSQIFLVILLIVMVVMIFKNIQLIKQNKNMKRYFVCTDAILNFNEDADKIIADFIANEENNELKNKARILKLIAEVDRDEYSKDTLSFLSYDDIVFTKGAFDKKKFEFNSDSFFWSVIAMVKAHNHNRTDVIEGLKEKYAPYEKIELFKKDVVINLLYEVDKAMSSYGDKGVIFFKKLLSGEYSEYTYDKRMIGFYKNVAATMLVYLNEELEEDDLTMVKEFAKLKAGKILLTELNLYERFHEEEVIDEIVEETNDEDTKEIEHTEETLEDEKTDDVIDAEIKVVESEETKEDK